MEQFKLRMWNSASQSYLYDIDNVFECLKQQHKFDGTMPDRGFVVEYNHKSEGMKWEMFIGKKDKNEKEVYEGDIISYKGALGLVYYDTDSAMFMAHFKLLRSRYSFDSIDEEFEVVGDINSLPKLIES